jgi:hypothetical protein
MIFHVFRNTKIENEITSFIKLIKLGAKFLFVKLGIVILAISLECVNNNRSI